MNEGCSTRIVHREAVIQRSKGSSQVENFPEGFTEEVVFIKCLKTDWVNGQGGKG